MDAEALKSLLWIVVFGGLFFFMMRYGCGAHIGGHGRHGGHGKSKGTPDTGAAKDPVCGMTVDPQRAAGASVHQGTTYYFCSTSCRDKFEQAPARYLVAGGQAGGTHGGHHHG